MTASIQAMPATAMLITNGTTLTDNTQENGTAPSECPNCGKRLRGNARFCSRCGYSFTGAAPKRVNLRGEAVAASAGQVLNEKYRLIKPIGRSGSGNVYLAHDQVLNRLVVIKTLLTSDDPELVKQRVHEREFLATLKHPNIVGIYDFFTVGAEGYIVMEYVKGMTLYQMIEEQGKVVDVPDMIRYILSILPAFNYLAKLGLVYGDFSPHNLMIEELGDGSSTVKLIDLGTVIRWTPHPEIVYGTPGFYAPEAVYAPSPATDLYTICRTLAWAITWIDLEDPQFGMPPAEKFQVFQDYPMLYRLLVKGTHTNPARRFRTASELLDQLAGVLRMIVGGDPATSVASRFFVPRMMTPPGNPGRRGETVLDQADPAIALLQQGDLELRSDNLTNAFDDFSQALSINTASIDGLIRQAEVLIERGQFSHALANLTRARRLAPDSWKVSWYTGHLLEARGHFGGAAEHYHMLIADLPGELPPLQALARVYSAREDDATAAHLYATVLRADPDDTDAIFGLARSLLNLRQWDDAIQVLASVRETSSKYVDAQLTLCDIWLTRIQPLTPQALAQAAQAIAALHGRTEDPRYYRTRAEMFRLAWRMGREDKLPANIALAGVDDTSVHVLGEAAEASYTDYLRREPNPPDRETVIRHRFEVAPWRPY